MAVSLFVGVMGGALLGFVTQNGRYSFCTYIREKHPTLFKSVGLILILGLILVPTAILYDVFVFGPTPWLWGGCMGCSFLFGFFTANCAIYQEEVENKV